MTVYTSERNAYGALCESYITEYDWGFLEIVYSDRVFCHFTIVMDDFVGPVDCRLWLFNHGISRRMLLAGPNELRDAIAEAVNE